MKSYCRLCLLPAVVPGAQVDSQGVCAYCRTQTQEKLENDESVRARYEADLERALADCRGVGEYDCLVSFSGGKDSVYLLHNLVSKYKLKVLAYTSNFDQPRVAQNNIAQTIKTLGVDHISYTPSPSFYRKFIRFLLMNQRRTGAVHTVCYFWLNIREGDMLKLAVQKGIPLILSGYAPGQPDSNRMVYEMPPSRISGEDWTPHDLFESGLFASDELDRFWNPLKYPVGTIFPRFIAPFHAWKYDQSKVISTVVKLGLIRNKRHANPLLSNFTLNWLFMYSDLKNLGYNPYIPEFSQLIRQGKASKTLWRILHPLANFMIKNQIFLGANIKKGLRWLDLHPADLKITDKG